MDEGAVGRQVGKVRKAPHQGDLADRRLEMAAGGFDRAVLMRHVLFVGVGVIL